MEDESSNDVESVETDGVQEKPIMTLFKRLIDKTAKAILTNAQITQLIHQEFNVNVKELHPLQLNIYVDIMKKFLKDWPQWDEFDRFVNKHKAENDREGLDRLLEKKHNELIQYLTLMLETARKPAERAVKEVERQLKEKKADYNKNKKDERNVVMEVQCTRARLNQLIYRYPHPELNHTVFNLEDITGSNRICSSPPTYQSVLNWWNIKIQVNLSQIKITRETVHEFKHVLVNHKLPNEPKQEVLDTNLKKKVSMNKTKSVPKEELLKCLDQVKAKWQKTAMKTDMEVLLWFLRDDIKDDGSSTVAVPATYRRYMFRHPYIRYSNVEVPNAQSDTYNLALEETLHPMYQYTIDKCHPSAEPVGSAPKEELSKKNVYVKCEPCDAKFTGAGLLKALQQHFWTVHTNEADWRCTGCKKVFKMASLSGQKWHHDCDSACEQCK